MRTLLLSALLLLVGTNTWANEKMYNKLNKLYLVDREKCMDKSKNYIKKNNKESIPYYFTSIIYYDKSKESQTLRGTYLQLMRSASSASKFEKYSKTTERNLVHWDEHIVSLKNRAERLITALNQQEMQDLSENLTKNLSKVESLASYFNPNEQKDILENITLIEKPEIEVESTDKFVKIEGQFYGLPKGNERVASTDESKEQELLQLINLERSKRNLPALVWDGGLTNAARYHAFDQGTQGYFSHASNDKINDKHVVVGNTMERIRRFYRNGEPQGECIAAGNVSAQNTLTQWLNSDGHAKIILDPKTRYIGIGFVQIPESTYQNYWVLTTGI